MTVSSYIDHLVVAADTLEHGMAWCEATLGVTPRAGGEHPLMGTHNRLLSLSTQSFPRAYFEIIAINPHVKPPGRRRWFDLDDPELQQAVHKQPRLVHFVARTPDASSALKELHRLGIDRGSLVRAERPTPEGLLRWKISVRDDGQRLFYGALPTLIQWDDAHPADAMPSSGLALQSRVVCNRCTPLTLASPTCKQPTPLSACTACPWIRARPTSLPPF